MERENNLLEENFGNHEYQELKPDTIGRDSRRDDQKPPKNQILDPSFREGLPHVKLFFPEHRQEL